MLEPKESILLPAGLARPLPEVHRAVLHPEVDSLRHVDEQARVHHTCRAEDAECLSVQPSRVRGGLNTTEWLEAKSVRNTGQMTSLKPSPTGQRTDSIAFISSCGLFPHPTVLLFLSLSSVPPQHLCWCCSLCLNGHLHAL